MDRKYNDISSRLSPLVIDRNKYDVLSTLAEIELENGSIVLGAYSFLGFIDDKNKTVVSFSAEERKEYSYFYQAYKGLIEDEGYEAQFLTPNIPVYPYRQRGEPGPVKIKAMLETYDVFDQTLDILSRESKPLAGVVFALNSAEHKGRGLSETMNASAHGEPHIQTASGTSAKMRIAQEHRTNWEAAAKRSPRVFDFSK